MSLEDIVYQSLFFFSFFLLGILGLSFFVHLFRKNPPRKVEHVETQSQNYVEEKINSELRLAEKKRREIIAEAERKRVMAIKRERELEMRRRMRYSVVTAPGKSTIPDPGSFMRSTVIENRSLEFYQ